MKQINQLITDITQKLHTAYDDDVLCEQYAWWLIEALTKQKQAELIAADMIELKPKEQQQLDIWLDELITQHKPLQYILGSVPFVDLEILVEPPVLIPRPETEQLCLYVIQQLKQAPTKDLKILDMCTGSGCIALAIAQVFPDAQVYASDISDKALALIKKNIAHNKVTNVTVISSDLFKKFTHDKFDMIIANPPYISQDEWPKLDPSVTQWEDQRALVAEDDGLAIEVAIIKQAPRFMQKNKFLKEKKVPQLVLEIGYDQGSRIKKIMELEDYNQVEIHKDLQGKDRIVTGRVDYVAPATKK